MRWLLLLLTLPAQAEISCDDWLKSTKAVPGHPDCEIICSASMTDMRTFTCPMRCPKYCGSACALDGFWQSALNADPSPFKALNEEERKKVSTTLSKFPEALQPQALKAIVKSTKPNFMAPTNPATSSDELIILFPSAFNSEVPLERILFHELAHLLTAGKWSASFSAYKKMSGWSSVTEKSIRPGNFVEQDGRDSAEEDFANNVEYFVFSPNQLKDVSPKFSLGSKKT